MLGWLTEGAPDGAAALALLLGGDGDTVELRSIMDNGSSFAVTVCFLSCVELVAVLVLDCVWEGQWAIFAIHSTIVC